MANFFSVLATFDKARRFDGTNWPAYKQEFTMTFQVDAPLMRVIKGTEPAPSDADKRAAWDAHQANGMSALYKTISSDLVRTAHFVPSSPRASDVWKSLVAEYEKDNRSTRMQLKRALYQPVHDVTQPVSVYISGIVDAANNLAAIGQPARPTDIIDTIIMCLDSSWSTIQMQLMSASTDPQLADLRGQLVEFEKQQQLLHGDHSGVDAHLARRQKHSSLSRRHNRGGSGSDSGGEEFDWLNAESDGCHRCGRSGHQASRCMANMPAHIKDAVMKEVKRKRRNRENAHHVTVIPDPADYEYDSDTSSIIHPAPVPARPVKPSKPSKSTAHFAGHAYSSRPRGSSSHESDSSETSISLKKLVKRMHRLT